MSQEGKREWQAAAKASRAQPVQAAQGPAPRRQDPVAPWPHCGDTFYPMKEELVQGISRSVRQFNKDWLTRIGADVVQPGPKFHAPPVASCEDCYGRGHCSQTLPADVFQKLTMYQKRLDRWSAICKTKPTAYDGMWKPLPLFYVGVGPSAAAGHEDVPSGLAVLLLFKQTKNQVYYAEQCVLPRRGDVISFTPDPQKLITNVDLSWAWLEAGPFACQITYRQVGLASYEVQELNDMSDVESRHARERAEAAQITRMSNLMSNFDEAAKKRTASTRAGQRGGRRPRQSGKPKDGSDADGADDVDESSQLLDPCMDLFDHEISEDPELQLRDDHDDNDDDERCPDEFDGLVPGDVIEEMELDLWSHAAADDAGPLSDSDDDGQPEGAGAPAEEWAFLEVTTGQVRNPSNHNEGWGRISMIKEGTAQEAVSVYCRRHGCAILRGVHRSPPTADILRWFAQGQAVERGRSSALQAKHKAMFPAA